MLYHWTVPPAYLPLVLQRCHACSSERFRADGKVLVNANHQLADAWLLVLRTGCGETAKLAVPERAKVRSIRPVLLDRLHHNDPGLAAELLQDPVLRRRNRIALDRDGARRLDTSGPDHVGQDAIDVSAGFAARIPVRPARLLAEGRGLARAEVERLIAEGRGPARAEVERLIAEGKAGSGVRPSGKLSGDFSFTLKRRAAGTLAPPGFPSRTAAVHPQRTWRSPLSISAHMSANREPGHQRCLNGQSCVTGSGGKRCRCPAPPRWRSPLPRRPRTGVQKGTTRRQPVDRRLP
ncbi:DUF1062 domain-containing protein [Amycolatopsis rubida]|uniref:DUF1062 domain-containing protein n=1 Tax=Amycolatopsis rubida TaxID=112413 RepID=A0ABX0BL50_9PSEU|nr:DUF1062 domain-containing protein [Amycolatopsis rubida]NEC55244.1 DUF1062 domain-containing protein [Amycolatopsis rubida]